MVLGCGYVTRMTGFCRRLSDGGRLSPDFILKSGELPPGVSRYQEMTDFKLKSAKKGNKKNGR